MDKVGLKIYLNDGTEIVAPDIFDSEELAIEQMTNYGTTGYYSRVKKTYFPPSAILFIMLIPVKENKS